MSVLSPLVTLTNYVNSYLGGRLRRGEISRSTASAMRWTLYQFADEFGNRPLNHLTAKAVDRWLETIGHLSEATRRNYLSRVRMFCQWMLAEGHIHTDPTAHVPAIRQARRAPRTLTASQVRRLLMVLPDRRAKAVVWLMVGCGLRCVEVARLRVEDYDPAGRTVTVQGKADHERTVAVPADVARAVDAYLDETGVMAGPLVRSELHPNRGVSPKTLSTYLRWWMRDAGVKHRPLDGRSAHALRRTCASDVLDHSGDLRAVQEMLGHRRLETTARSYLRPVSLEQLRKAMEGRHYADEPEAA
jgi:site-specific recombinase XerD